MATEIIIIIINTASCLQRHLDSSFTKFQLFPHVSSICRHVEKFTGAFQFTIKMIGYNASLLQIYLDLRK